MSISELAAARFIARLLTVVYWHRPSCVPTSNLAAADAGDCFGLFHLISSWLGLQNVKQRVSEFKRSGFESSASLLSPVCMTAGHPSPLRSEY